VNIFFQGDLKYCKAILPTTELEDDGHSGDENGDVSVGRRVRLVGPPLQNKAFGADPDKLKQNKFVTSVKSSGTSLLDKVNSKTKLKIYV
jgi:hypothetical protein